MFFSAYAVWKVAYADAHGAASCLQLSLRNRKVPTRRAYATYAALQNTHHQPTQLTIVYLDFMI